MRGVQLYNNCNCSKQRGSILEKCPEERVQLLYAMYMYVKKCVKNGTCFRPFS